MEDFMFFLHYDDQGVAIENNSNLIKKEQMIRPTDEVELKLTTIVHNPYKEITKKGDRIINQLGAKYAEIFCSEWGESMGKDVLGEMLQSLGENCVLSILETTEGNPVGAALMSRRQRYELGGYINKVLADTTDNGTVSFDPEGLPNEMIYWDEVFISPDYRHGIEPYRILANETLGAAIEKFGNLDVVFFTKEHRLLNPVQQSELTAEFRRIEPRCSSDIIDKWVKIVSLMDRNRIEKLKKFHPGIADLIDEYTLGRRQLSVMKTAKLLRMDDLTPEDIARLDRHIFKISSSALKFFTGRARRGTLAAAGALINAKRKFIS